ncbi:MAG: hypothetical protein ABIW81_03170 [Terrimesophilobacter sp.]
MDKVLPTIIVVAVILLAFVGMFAGWRARAARQRDIPRPPEPPTIVSESRAAADGLYVATTLADQPLERVAVRGLGFRSRATITVTDEGLILELTGQNPVFIASAAILNVDRSSWVIDKGVEPGGLLRIAWRLGETDVDSYLRLDNSTETVLSVASTLVGGTR